MEKTPRFTYGDCIRRTDGGPVLTVSDIGSNAYYFADGTFALTADQDCYTLVKKASGFFRVALSLDGLPVNDYLQHGYEYREDFIDGLNKLLKYWGGRTGERVGERNKFLQLHFHDTPGGKADKAWLPLYMLTPTDKPDYLQESERDEEDEELNRIFGFDC